MVGVTLDLPVGKVVGCSDNASLLGLDDMVCVGGSELIKTGDLVGVSDGEFVFEIVGNFVGRSVGVLVGPLETKTDGFLSVNHSEVQYSQ